MKIGICDDEPVIATSLMQLIERSIEDMNKRAELVIFTTGTSLLARIEEFDVVFLDIEMPQMDGIEVGREIKKRNSKCKIIMATGMVERFKESFKISAFRFITKPFVFAEVEEAMYSVMKERLGEDTIKLFLNRIEYDIPQNKVKFVRAFNGYVEAMIDHTIFRKDCSLLEMEKELDDRLFIRVHKQFIVNMEYIEGYSSSQIKIEHIEIPIARRKQKEFEKRYMEYDVEYRG